MTKAYYIGGAQDLSCRTLDHEPESIEWFCRPERMPIRPSAPEIVPSMGRIVKERYRVYHLPDQDGNAIAVYIYDGDER